MTADRNPSAGTRSASEATSVRAADAQPRECLGIPFDLLATGDRLMVTRMHYETTARDRTLNPNRSDCFSTRH